jgi:hypothetical protein
VQGISEQCSENNYMAVKTAKERIIEALQRAGKRPVDLARELDLERGTVSEMLKKPGDPPVKYIEAAIKLTGFSYEWITTGMGEIEDGVIEHDHASMQEPSVDYLSGKNIRPITVTVDRAGKELISYVPVKAQAGYRKGFGDPNFVEQLPAFNLPVNITGAGTHRMFQVDGNSMRQLGGGGLNDGDIVIAQYVEDIFGMKDGRVYVVVSTEGVVIKRCINRLLTEDKVVIANSDNKNGEFPPIILHPHEILEVWELKAFISKQLSLATDLWDVINDLTVKQAMMQEELKEIKTKRIGG